MFVGTVCMCAVAKEKLNRIPVPIRSGKMERSGTCGSDYGSRRISARVAFWKSGKGGVTSGAKEVEQIGVYLPRGVNLCPIVDQEFYDVNISPSTGSVQGQNTIDDGIDGLAT
jgi:hypothetical protein